MVETRRSSSSKRALSSSPPNPKRSKAAESASSTSEVPSGHPLELSPVKESGSVSAGVELRSPDPAIEDPLKAAEEFDATVTKKSAEDDGEVQALVSPQSLDEEAVVDAEKSKTVVPATSRGKRRPSKLPKSAPKEAWGKLLSQCSQVENACVA